MSSRSLPAVSLLAALVGLAGLACAGQEPSSPGFADPDEDPGENGRTRYLPYSRSVDLLLVLDNTSSTARAQATLATELPAMLEELVAEDVDLRLGVTTTDNGNPWCPVGVTTPEGGKLVASSCNQRLDEFFHDTLELDVEAEACTDFCSLAELSFEPTTTAVDPDPSPRPWLEASRRADNLPEGVELGEAVACMVPQGIEGCGFISPLESTYLSLARIEDSNEASYGFLRPGAVQAVVIMADSSDCSYNESWAEIFEQDGQKTFWSDPLDPFPTQALCWNAGVECLGDPSAYDSCDPIDQTANGVMTDDPSLAVLHPVSRLVDRLQGLENEQQTIHPDRQLLVSVIAGVAEAGETPYAAASDPELAHEFGIGPGCTQPDGSPVPPPVRLRAVAEAFPELAPSSVCAPSYAEPLAALATAIEDQLPDNCVYTCPWDEDPDTEIVDPQCSVFLDAYGPDDSLPLEACARDDQGAFVLTAEGDYTIPAGESGCYALRVDREGLSPDPGDDMSARCLDQGLYLEVAVELDPALAKSYELGQIGIRCIESRFPEQYCPDFVG